ncbi:hypothetical protein OK006_9194 [Actinobacteria bacterium OK006]|nr:hypothetical protein OK006_9194 [Actinobacteria bacterium OK006]
MARGGPPPSASRQGRASALPALPAAATVLFLLALPLQLTGVPAWTRDGGEQVDDRLGRGLP